MDSLGKGLHSSLKQNLSSRDLYRTPTNPQYKGRQNHCYLSPLGLNTLNWQLPSRKRVKNVQGIEPRPDKLLVQRRRDFFPRDENCLFEVLLEKQVGNLIMTVQERNTKKKEEEEEEERLSLTLLSGDKANLSSAKTISTKG